MPPKYTRGRGSRRRGRFTRKPANETPISQQLAQEAAPEPVDSQESHEPVAESHEPVAESVEFHVVEVEVEEEQVQEGSVDYSDGSSDGTSASQKSKKFKTLSDLSPEEEIRMIEWLQVNPIFYNKKLASYKETAKKERMWKQQSVEMRKSVVVLKTWYTSLRSRFGRLKKKKSGAGDTELTERDAWVVKSFDFLRPYIYEVQKRPIVSIKQKIAAECDDPEVEDEGDATGARPKSTSATSWPAQQPVASSTPRPRTQKQLLEAEDAFMAGIEDRGNQLIDIQKQVLGQLRPNANKERDAFVDWVRSVVHELDHGLWRRCQYDISNVLYKYIGENDQMKSTQPQEPAQHGQPVQVHQGSNQATTAMWPQPNQWTTQPSSSISVWQSQEANWLAQKYAQQFPAPQPLTLTQLQPTRPASTGPTFQPVTMAAWEATPSRPLSVSHSSAGDLSSKSQSSFHLSDYINVSDPDPETQLPKQE